MEDDHAFVRAFEAATLLRHLFTHAGHVRAGWWYLTHHPLGEAIDRFSAALRAYATALGAPHKYHETMTVTWLLLIVERLDGESRRLSWTAFAGRYPELLDGDRLLKRYYTDDVLQSDRARRMFVMPGAVGGRT